MYPFGWKDDRAAAYAAERDAVLAVGRLEARVLADAGRPVPPSLSPAGLLDADPVPRLVLPSPNGSTICSALRRPGGPAGPEVVGAALRNRTAVATWLAPRVAAGATVAFVPAGERWPDGSLRPAFEDLWGAGAVLAMLLADLPADVAGRVSVSVEARQAAATYSSVEGRVADALHGCSSGRELAAAGFVADVAAAAEVDSDDVVPLLGDDGFAPTTGP